MTRPKLPDPLPTYLLAGGNSSRFGRDKAQATFRGETLLDHAARSLAPVADPLTVVTRGGGAGWGGRTIHDPVPNQGPLGGLYAALADAGDAPWVLLTSCDWLGVRVAWVAQLAAARQPDAQVVAFRGQWWEPLLGLYHTSLLPLVATRLDRGERAMWRLIDAVPHVAVPLPVDWHEAVQVNTPADLARAAAVDGP